MRSNYLLTILIVSGLLFSVLSYGDVPTVVNGFTASIGTGAWISIASALAIASEFVMRLLPSQAPLSWAWLISNSLMAVGGALQALAKWLDTWLPQNTQPKQ